MWGRAVDAPALFLATHDGSFQSELAGFGLMLVSGLCVLALLVVGITLLLGRLTRPKREQMRYLGFVLLHLTDYFTNVLTLGIVFLVKHRWYFWVLLSAHLVIGIFCIYTAFTRLDWKQWCCLPQCNFFAVVVVMGLMQGIQLRMAHDDYKNRQASLAADEESELRVPSMMPARFHFKAMDGLLEGTVFSCVAMYAVLKDQWLDVKSDPLRSWHLDQAWYAPCLYISSFCSILSVGFALMEIDHRTSASVQRLLDESAVSCGVHLVFRSSEFCARLLTVLVFCMAMQTTPYWWLAYVLIALDYILGVVLLITLGGRDPVREASILLGIPLFMANIMQFVDAPGMSLQARRISAVIGPLRALELLGVVMFAWWSHYKMKVRMESETPESMDLGRFLVNVHPSWAVTWVVSFCIYYLFLCSYARRTKPGADLHSAVAYGEVEVLKELLRSSELVLDIKRFGPDGRNPLHLAARRGEVECMRLLVEENAELQARTGNKQKNMALHLAAMNQDPAAVRFLCQACAGDRRLLNATNGLGETALHIAARQQNVEVLRELLRYPGVDSRAVDKAGLVAAECAPEGRFEFDQESAQCDDLLRAAEANIRPPPRQSVSPRQARSARSECSAEPTVSECEMQDLSSRSGNSFNSKSPAPATSKSPSPSASPSSAAAAASSAPEMSRKEHALGEQESRPKADLQKSVPLVSVGPEAEKAFNRKINKTTQPEDMPLVVTNCGLSSFMLSAGTGAVGRFFLGAIAEESEGKSSEQACAVALQDFSLIKVVGEGAFGKVQLVRLKETGELYAMKTLDKAKFRAQKITSKAHSEQFLLRTTRHPFIVQLHFAFQCSSYWALVMEYCPNGDLQGFLLKHGSPGIALQEVARYSGEVLLALEHLHSINVIFRDLKLENVVICPNFRSKVTDFGLAKKLSSASDARTMCGSYGYAAPEIMANTGRYTYAVDLYSFGVMIYMMVSGGEVSTKNPQQKNRLPPMKHRQLQKKLNDFEKAQDARSQWARPNACVLPFLRSLLSEVPAARTTATELKDSPFFAKHLGRPVDSLLTDPGPFSAPKSFSGSADEARSPV